MESQSIMILRIIIKNNTPSKPALSSRCGGRPGSPATLEGPRAGLTLRYAFGSLRPAFAPPQTSTEARPQGEPRELFLKAVKNPFAPERMQQKKARVVEKNAVEPKA
jgi:hypothetical protein